MPNYPSDVLFVPYGKRLPRRADKYRFAIKEMKDGGREYYWNVEGSWSFSHSLPKIWFDKMYALLNKPSVQRRVKKACKALGVPYTPMKPVRRPVRRKK